MRPRDRSRATLEVLRQKELLDVTFASIGDAVIVTDIEGKITFLNEVLANLTGWTLPEVRNQPCAKVFNIINENTRAAVESPVDKVLRLGTIIGLANHTLLIRRDGSEVPIDDSGAPIKEADGTVRGVVLIFRDFSHHKAAENRLIEANNALEAASHAKDRFLGPFPMNCGHCSHRYWPPSPPGKPVTNCLAFFWPMCRCCGATSNWKHVSSTTCWT